MSEITLQVLDGLASNQRCGVVLQLLGKVLTIIHCLKEERFEKKISFFFCIFSSR